jgi:inorganic pyrophosphatase
MKALQQLTLLLITATLISCQNKEGNQLNLLSEVSPDMEGAWINMVVEIPSGSTEKWEVNKKSGVVEADSLDGKPRIINYLGYPGNYGFIPQTLLPKSEGGDGDPLDIIAIGNAAPRGSILRCKIIGVLKLIDTGEMDDKLIAIAKNSTLQDISTIEELKASYPGMLVIIETWFTNYKGRGKMESSGYQGLDNALEMIEISKEAFQF